VKNGGCRPFIWWGEAPERPDVLPKEIDGSYCTVNKDFNRAEPGSSAAPRLGARLGLANFVAA